MTQALYRVVSTRPGQRDWNLIRHYYHPVARLVRTGLQPDGSPFAKVMSFDAYIENVDQLVKEQFSEMELVHEATVFGNVARLTSVYAFTRQSGGETRHGR